MSVVVEIVAVGALVQIEGSDRVRPVSRGAHVVVSEEKAKQMIARGTAKFADDAIAEHAEAEQPDAGAVDLEAMTVPLLRKYADARRINLHGATAKADIIEAIEASDGEGGA